jgi:hypothetical protein
MPLNILETIIIVVLTIWSILWKCYSVWNAAKHSHKKWFIALIILNTIGILDMIYVFKVLKKDFKTVKNDFARALDFLR